MGAESFGGKCSGKKWGQNEKDIKNGSKALPNLLLNSAYHEFSIA